MEHTVLSLVTDYLDNVGTYRSLVQTKKGLNAPETVINGIIRKELKEYLGANLYNALESSELICVVLEGMCCENLQALYKRKKVLGDEEFMSELMTCIISHKKSFVDDHEYDALVGHLVDKKYELSGLWILIVRETLQKLAKEDEDDVRDNLVYYMLYFIDKCLDHAMRRSNTEVNLMFRNKHFVNTLLHKLLEIVQETMQDEIEKIALQLLKKVYIWIKEYHKHFHDEQPIITGEKGGKYIINKGRKKYIRKKRRGNQRIF